jgi:hypothetical protein
VPALQHGISKPGARHAACCRTKQRLDLPALLENDAMTATEKQIGDMVLRVQTDFLDDPSLCLTLSRARKRFGFDHPACAGVFGALVDARVLTHREGVYRRHVPQLAEPQAA